MQGQSTKRRAPRPRVERTCQQCSTVFSVRPSAIDAGNGMYCSLACRRAARRTQVTRTCGQCGATFTAKPSEITLRGALYCSRACREAHDMPTPESIAQRLREHSERQADGCLAWTGRLTPAGYGRTSIGGDAVGAHVAAYELVHGPVPKKHHLDHLCHNADPSCSGGAACLHRRCIDVIHLEAVPPRTNILRGKGLAAKNAQVTHCPQGHPYDGDNLYINPSGGRECRTCGREKAKLWGCKKRAEKATK